MRDSHIALGSIFVKNRWLERHKLSMGECVFDIYNTYIRIRECRINHYRHSRADLRWVRELNFLPAFMVVIGKGYLPIPPKQRVTVNDILWPLIVIFQLPLLRSFSWVEIAITVCIKHPIKAHYYMHIR